MFFAYDYGISKDRKSNSIFRNIAWAVSLDGQRVAARSEQQRDESAICAGVHPHISCARRFAARYPYASYGIRIRVASPVFVFVITV